MTFRILTIVLFSFTLLAGCKTKMNNLTLSTCKAIATNSKKCSELVSEDLELMESNQTSVLEKEILLDIANSHPHLIKNPSPKVIFKNFGDNALEFELIFTYNNGFRVNLIESDIRFLVHKSFKENNIEIPFPQRVVHLQK